MLKKPFRVPEIDQLKDLCDSSFPRRGITEAFVLSSRTCLNCCLNF